MGLDAFVNGFRQGPVVDSKRPEEQIQLIPQQSDILKTDSRFIQRDSKSVLRVNSAFQQVGISGDDRAVIGV